MSITEASTSSMTLIGDLVSCAASLASSARFPVNWVFSHWQVRWIVQEGKRKKNKGHKAKQRGVGCTKLSYTENFDNFSIFNQTEIQWSYSIAWWYAVDRWVVNLACTLLDFSHNPRPLSGDHISIPSSTFGNDKDQNVNGRWLDPGRNHFSASSHPNRLLPKLLWKVGGVFGTSHYTWLPKRLGVLRVCVLRYVFSVSSSFINILSNLCFRFLTSTSMYSIHACVRIEWDAMWNTIKFQC